VGNAAALLFEADDVTHFGMRWMEAQYHGPLP
jgi:hypothetical protein